MAKKKKQPLKTPKLCLKDKRIYLLLLILCAAAPLLTYVALGALRRLRMLSGITGAAAFSSTAGILLCMPCVILPAVFGAVLLCYGLKIRKPLFGDREIRYGSEGLKEIYPLLGPQSKRIAVSEEERGFRRKLAGVCAALLIVSLLLAVPGTGCGKRLYEDGRMDTVGLFGRTVTSGPVPASLDFSTVSGAGYRAEIGYADGRKGTFTASDFLISHSEALKLIYSMSGEKDPLIYTCTETVPRRRAAVSLGLDTEAFGLLEQLLD